MIIQPINPEMVLMFESQLNTSAEEEETFKKAKHPTAAANEQQTYGTPYLLVFLKTAGVCPFIAMAYNGEVQNHHDNQHDHDPNCNVDAGVPISDNHSSG
ncbi:hypothetical protein WICPIJ_003944 [Wickerhamomyces pijperi]|uniref:Uncharacterized protein n=1 Tax=Wickerhamomyces pijperi TaxID=599730 RepID=A0A9P8Q661_WICPI|nr:hypothetical protein WICPIJ_003944 [Wickerhamomyces pijperi]